MAPKKVWRKSGEVVSDEAPSEKKVWRKSACASDKASTKEGKEVVPSGSREAEWQDCVRIDEGARQVKVEMAGWALEDDDMDEWCSWFGAHLERAAVRTAVGTSVKFTAKEVDFSDNELTSVGMTKLLDVLMKYQIAVLILKLHHNRIISAGNLSMFLAACKGTLRELHLSHNELSTSAAGQIMIAAAAVKDADGNPSYPQPTKGGEGLTPFWLRMEQNFIDHKLLSEAVESAFAELGRPGRLFCSINGRGCTPRCCMRYRDDPPAVHVKFLANQRPRLEKTEREEVEIFEEVRKMLPPLPASSPSHTTSGPQGSNAISKGRGRGKHLAVGAAPGAAAPTGAPTAATAGAARAEQVRGATRVWKVKEALPSEEAPQAKLEKKNSFAARALPKALRELWQRETSRDAAPPICTVGRAEKEVEAPCTQPPSVAEAKPGEATASLEALQGEAEDHVEPPPEDCLLDRVQPCESTTVSEGETRSSSEPAQEGSCSQSSHSGLDAMQEALVTPSETPEGSEQPLGTDQAPALDSTEQAPARDGERAEVEEARAAAGAPSQPQLLDVQPLEKTLPRPPSQPPTLDGQFIEKTLPEPPSQPPALDKQPAEKMLPVPPSKPPVLESQPMEKTLPEPPTQPPALDSVPAEKMLPEPPEELWKSIMYNDENPGRKGNPAAAEVVVPGHKFNPAAAEFVPGHKLPTSAKVSATIRSFVLNPQAPTFIPTMTAPSKLATSAAVKAVAPSSPTRSAPVPREARSAVARAAAARSQEAVESSARAVLSAIRAARASQMRNSGSHSLALMDDDDSDDGVGIASVAWSSAGEDASVALRETSRPPLTFWRRVLAGGLFCAPQQLLLAFLQQPRNLPGSSDRRHLFVHSRATLYVLAIALSSFMLRLVLRAAAKRRK
mmetsp:Transcript_151994/g.269281  ORF Transcript_151994/g.269281 Transcript_151994/m.269281 type:complete len:900 (-) Transcript_151994:61-2760(-)